MTVAAGTTENGGDGARVRRASETERGERVDLGGAGASERGGKWERWVEAEASGRPYPLPASAPARWSGGDVPLLRPRSGEQGGKATRGGSRPAVGQLG